MYDLLLISPHNTQLGLFKRFVPRSVPLGIGLLAGYLRSHGIEAKLVDPATTVVFGGIHATVVPEVLLQRLEAPRPGAGE